jgi:hypothetical protein
MAYNPIEWTNPLLAGKRKKNRARQKVRFLYLIFLTQFLVIKDIPKADASGLRSKFEQLSSQPDDRVQQERERRKLEDEELKRREASKQKDIDVPAQRHQKGMIYMLYFYWSISSYKRRYPESQCIRIT